MFFDKYASITRLVALDSNLNKETYQAVSGMQAVRVNVQPASADVVALTNGVYGQTYTIFTATAGFKGGDRVTISGLFIDGYSLNKQLEIKGIENQLYGPIPHLQITAVDINQ